jgi:hypothetical protein
MQLQKPPKYNIGDLVCGGHAIVVKIHEKADYKEAFYFVHYIQTDKKEWVRESYVDFTPEQHYTMMVAEIAEASKRIRRINEIQNHHNE